MSRLEWPRLSCAVPIPFGPSGPLRRLLPGKSRQRRQPGLRGSGRGPSAGRAAQDANERHGGALQAVGWPSLLRIMPDFVWDFDKSAERYTADIVINESKAAHRGRRLSNGQEEDVSKERALEEHRAKEHGSKLDEPRGESHHRSPGDPSLGRIARRQAGNGKEHAQERRSWLASDRLPWLQRCGRARAHFLGRVLQEVRREEAGVPLPGSAEKWRREPVPQAR